MMLLYLLQACFSKEESKEIPEYQPLLDIAALEGNKILIDSDTEKEMLSEYLNEPFNSGIPFLGTPNQQVNFLFRGTFNDGDYGDLIELPDEAELGVFVFGTGIQGDSVDFITFDHATWQSVIEPLAIPSVSAEEEREKLKKVIYDFELEILKSGQTSFGMQNCLDKARGVFQLLHILQKMDLMKFHEIDIRKPYIGDAVHVSTRLIDKKTRTSYLVDSWLENDRVVVMEESLFKVVKKNEFKIKEPY